MQYLTIMLCNHRKPHECDALKDIFVYKNNWVGDSACGAVPSQKDGYCAYGERFNNLWALCAKPDGKLILRCVWIDLLSRQLYKINSITCFS